VDEVERFTRCGADGRQRGVGAGSIVFRLAASPASASAGGNTSAGSGSGRKTQADGGAAQGNQQDRIANGVQSGQLTAARPPSWKRKKPPSTRKRQRIAQPTAGS